MTKITDVCEHIRSKNAGPYWITLDFFFRDQVMFDAHAGAMALGADNIAALIKADPAHIKRHELRDLGVLKISYPRPRPQGGEIERDMHGGQQYIRFLGLEV